MEATLAHLEEWIILNEVNQVNYMLDLECIR